MTIWYIEVCTNSLRQLDTSFYSWPCNILSIFIIIGYCNKQRNLFIRHRGLSTELACNALVGASVWRSLNQSRHENIPSFVKIHDRHMPLSMPHLLKSALAAASLSVCWLLRSIWPRVSKWLDCCQGSFTALMCFNSVMDEHRPFGAPKRWIAQM